MMSITPEIGRGNEARLSRDSYGREYPLNTGPRLVPTRLGCYYMRLYCRCG